jgi:hypothetical protein
VSDRERGAIKLRRMRDRLGDSSDLEFPERPKGMHRKRYARLRQAYERESNAVVGKFHYPLSSLAARIG